MHGDGVRGGKEGVEGERKVIERGEGLGWKGTR